MTSEPYFVSGIESQISIMPLYNGIYIVLVGFKWTKTIKIMKLIEVGFKTIFLLKSIIYIELDGK